MVALTTTDWTQLYKAFSLVDHELSQYQRLFWLTMFDVAIDSNGHKSNVKPDWPESQLGIV